MLRLLLSLLAGALLWGSGLAGAQALQPVPELAARVTDLTATLTEEERGSLETKLADFERAKGAQIAVLLVPTVQPETIEAYAIRVAEAWKLGRKNVDDGALLIVAKQDRKLRIEVGYGLEGALNDATSKRIVSDLIAPRFKQGDYYGGIETGVNAMISVVSGESLPEPAASTDDAQLGDSLQSLFPVLLVLVLFGGGVSRLIFGRLPGAAIIAALAGGISWLLLTPFAIAGIVGGIVAIVSFAVTLLTSGSHGGRHGSWGGGSWSSGGGSSWGSGDSGGFSGGGGGFGGGGASGDW